MKRLSFPKSKRLLSNDQFRAVLDRGRRASDGLLTLYVAPNDCGHARLGVSVGKSHGGAVVRNRLKRLLREAFRQSQEQIPAGFDYVLMISQNRRQRTEDRRPKSDFGLPTSDFRPPTSDLRTLAFEQVKASFLALVSSPRITRRPARSSGSSDTSDRSDRSDRPGREPKPDRRSAGHEEQI